MVNLGLILEYLRQTIQVKYIVFTVALLCVIPAVAALVLDKRLIRYAILGLIIPIVNFNGSAINFLSMEQYRGTARGMEISLCYIIAATIFFAILLRGGFKLNLPYIGSFLFFLYFMFSVLSLRHSGDRIISFFEIWKMMMMYLVFLAVSSYMEYTKGDFDILNYGLGAFIVLSFLFVLKQHFEGTNQVKGFFPHQNSFAMFLVLANVVQFSLALNSRRWIQTGLYLFVFCCGAVCTLRTYSRGGFISFPVSIIVCFTISLLFQFRARKVSRSLLILFLGMMGFLIFLPKIILRFENAHVNSYETRVQFVTVALNIIRDNKMFGVGINNWSRTLQRNKNYKFNRKTNERTDLIGVGIVETIYLLVAAECGIPCLVALLLWFFYYFFISIKLAFCLRNTKYFYFPAATAGGLLGIYVQSMLEWVLKQSMNFMLLMIVFAMLSYLNRNYKKLIQREEEEARQANASEVSDEPEPTPETEQELALQ